MDPLEIKVGIQISKPIDEVFDAIVDPEQMKNYFISGSSGRIAEGETLQWEFPEFEGETPIRVVKVIPPTCIAFEWEGAKDKKMKVTIDLSEMDNDSTLVRITEGTMRNTEAGILWLRGNTEGWANFLSCLKAYMEYGINLRKGAFNYMRK